MTAKQFIKKTILLIILILVLVGALVFIIDPFSRYHAPFFGLDTVETDERAAVIGIARNIEYDTALIGSSMSENFKDSWFEDGILGSKCVKLPLQGGHFGDYKPLLEEVTNHPGTKNIFFCLDTYLFVDEDSAYPRTIEDYYISKPGLTDVKYLYNKSVLFEYIPKFLVTNHKENFSDENAYIYQANCLYVCARYRSSADPFSHSHFDS